MQPALEIVMSGLFDYAGLFPPAKLSLDSAVENYFTYCEGPEDWLVSRFVCPAKQLPDLAQILKGKEEGPEFALSVLGSGGETLSEWESNLEVDAKLMDAFDQEFGESAPIEAFEVRISQAADMPQIIRDLGSFDHIDVFLEVPLQDQWEDALAALAESEWLAAKFRSGGVTPESVPAPEVLAKALIGAIDLDLNFKLTAGLHEPFRHIDPAVGADVHGFLNIVAASALHIDQVLSTPEFATILADTDSRKLEFSAEGMTWGGRFVRNEVIEDLRDRWIAIGSCSIVEPIEGLQKLGLMGVLA